MSTHARELPVELKELLPPRLHARCANGRYARGTTLFETGRRPAFMFYVASGEVTLERHGIHGEPVVMQRCRRGFVGEASLHSSRYHCDARVVTDAEISRIRCANSARRWTPIRRSPCAGSGCSTAKSGDCGCSASA